MLKMFTIVISEIWLNLCTSHISINSLIYIAYIIDFDVFFLTNIDVIDEV